MFFKHFFRFFLRIHQRSSAEPQNHSSIRVLWSARRVNSIFNIYIYYNIYKC